MIRTEPASRRAASAATLHRIAVDPLAGPNRHADSATAMARDLQDIVAARGSADDGDLLARGWSAAEIAAHRPAAIGLMRGRAL